MGYCASTMKHLITLSLYTSAAYLAILTLPIMMLGVALSTGSFGYDVAALPLGIVCGMSSMLGAMALATLAEKVGGI